MPTAKFLIGGEVVRIPYEGERPTLAQVQERVTVSRSIFNPPAGETGLRAPTFWERARMTAGKAGPVAEFLTPGSWTEAGIQMALAAAPFAGKAIGKVAPKLLAQSPAVARWLTRGARVGLTAGGGAGGAAVGGEDIARGAKTGAAAAATGEVLATPIQWISRSVAGPLMQRLDSRRLAKVAGEIAPALKNVPPEVAASGTVKTAPELHRLVMGTTGEELLGQALATDLKPILAATKGQMFNFPALNKALGLPPPTPGPAVLGRGQASHAVTFEEALEHLRKIGRRGYTIAGDPRGAMNAFEARELRHQLRQEMTDALANPVKYTLDPAHRGIRSPVIAKRFDDAMQKYARGREVIDVLSEPRVWEGGRLNMRALQEMVSTEEYKTIARTLKQDAERFYRAVYRGGTALTRDVPGQLGLHARVYPGAGMPHVGVSLPRVPSYGGPETPALAQKGASLAPLTTFATLGLFGPERPADDDKGLTLIHREGDKP
jgi:hypothetical protein